jgi:Na+/proline symporter
VAVVGLIGILVALTEVRLVFWFVLFAWSGLGAAFAPLILLALLQRGVNRHGALAAMLTGTGVTVAWKLGRDAATNPEIFARVWWITLLVAAVVLVFGRLARAFDRGDQIGVVAAASFTVISWWLVQQWGLNNLYELVPAFFLAGFAALAVSSITRSTGGGSE